MLFSRLRGPAEPSEIDRDLLFYVLAAASFVEITSDVYTGNLVEFFRGDDEVTGWLEGTWQPEELNHGLVLKRYVEATWPEFDWESAYRGFSQEYRAICTVDQFAPSHALQMAALCVVETGTASFYRMLASLDADPALRHIAAEISADEVRHYKHFFRFFRRYRHTDRPSRLAVLRTLWGRMGAIDAEDAYIAFKHAYLGRNGAGSFAPRHYTVFRNACRRLAKRHFPVEMAVRMLLKPLGLSAALAHLALPSITVMSRRLLLR